MGTGIGMGIGSGTGERRWGQGQETGIETGDRESDGRLYSLWSLRTKNGIKVLVDFNPRRHVGEFCDVLVELGEYLIIELHDLLHSFLCDSERGFLQTCHCGQKTLEREALAGAERSAAEQTSPLLFRRARKPSSLSSFWSDSISALASIPMKESC